MSSTQDPGWRAALRSAVPFIGLSERRRAGWREPNGLLALRRIFIAVTGGVVLFPLSLAELGPREGPSNDGVLITEVVLGSLVLVAVWWIRRRRLTATSEEVLAASYRSLFIVGLGFAEVPLLFGIVGSFFTMGLSVLVIGPVSSLVGLSLIAPTRADIERRQQEISTAGSPLSLLHALTTPTPPGSGPQGSAGSS